MLSKKDLKEAMQSIKADIKDALGEQIHEEISKSFLENISGIAEIIQENFSLMRESTQQNFDGLKNDIAELKAKEI